MSNKILNENEVVIKGFDYWKKEFLKHNRSKDYYSNAIRNMIDLATTNEQLIFVYDKCALSEHLCHEKELVETKITFINGEFTQRIDLHKCTAPLSYSRALACKLIKDMFLASVNERRCQHEIVEAERVSRYEEELNKAIHAKEKADLKNMLISEKTEAESSLKQA